MAETADAPADRVAPGATRLRSILLAGVALRVVVYIFLEPSNNDPHWEVVEFILARGRLPLSTELTLSFHPPLYYVLAVPLAAIGTVKLVQGLSLLLSIFTLYLLYRLIGSSRLLTDARAKCHALVLTAILPQFVLFGLFVSNDGLSYAVGTLCYVQAFRYIDRPTRGNLALLGAVLGAGLLTKGTFLAFGPALVGLVLATELRGVGGPARVAKSLALFLSVVVLVGSYKYVENTIHFGRPIPTDTGGTVWETVIERQQADPRSRLGPGLLYLTFWYSYIDESNFEATRRPRILPGAIYLLALVPTALMAVGAGSSARRFGSPRSLLTAPQQTYGGAAREWVVLYVLAFHLLLVLAWGLMHGGAWSFYQARLTFAAFFSIALLLGKGLELAEQRGPKVGRSVSGLLWVLYGLFGLYYLAEVGAIVAARL